MEMTARVGTGRLKERKMERWKAGRGAAQQGDDRGKGTAGGEEENTRDRV